METYFMKPLEITKKKRTQRDYPFPFKLAVVESVEKGEMTYKQAQSIYGIQCKSTVLVWLRKHGTLDWSVSMRHLKKSPKAKETPAQKIKRLEQELKDEKDRNLLYREAIRIQDEENGTNFGKKVLSKQLEFFKKRN